MRFSYMSFTNTQRKILKVIYSPNFCSLHIVHCNCDCEVFFYKSSVCYSRFICCCYCWLLLVWLLFTVWKGFKRSLFFAHWFMYMYIVHTAETTQHVQIHHNVVLEVDSWFMDWSWRSLLSDILNDLRADIHKAFSVKKNK